MTTYKEIPDRLQSIADMRHEGKTFDAIGKEHNISRERARQLFMKYLRIVQFNKSMNYTSDNDIFKLLYEANEKLDNDTNSHLVIKTYNALRRSGFLTEENSKKLLSNEYSDDQLLRIKNFGVKSLKLLHTAIDIYNKC